MIVGTHHAYVVRGHGNEDISCLVSETEVYDCTREKFGVDDAREVSIVAHQTPSNYPMKSIVIRSNFITHEAQNALLKVLEEPPETTRFVILIPADVSLLDTIQSRTVEVSLESSHQPNTIFSNFQEATVSERLAQIESAVKKKDTEWQRAMKDGLIEYLTATKPSDTHLSEIEFVSRYLLTRGASNKMLLEHLALHL